MRRIFVCGSLRKGEINHDRFEGFGDTLVGTGSVGGAILKDLGTYPAMIPSANARDCVVGEVYEISDDLGDVLDRFERDEGYAARPVIVLDESAGVPRQIEAEAYFFAQPDRIVHEPTVERGDWARHDHDRPARPVRPPLRIGLVGCGKWGRHVLRDLVSCGCTVDVVAVSQDSVENARRGDAARIMARIADLGQTDGVIVVTPATTHVAVIEEVLSLWPGTPIYTEKPLSIDPAVASRVAREHASSVFVMHKWRYHPGVLELARIARSGELGPVVGLRVSREQWSFPARDVDPVWTHLPHVLSIALEILGTIPEPRCARVDRAGTDVTGITGTLGSRPWFSIHDSVRGLETRREVQLYCEGGVARLRDSYADAVEVARAGSLDDMRSPLTPERRQVSAKLPLLAQVEAFLDFIRGRGQAPKGTAAEDAAIVQAITTLRGLAEA